jgi:hypothetical protein
MTSHAAALLLSIGLEPCGPAAWATEVPSSEPGVYVVEIDTPVARAPIDSAVVSRWITRVPTLMLDGKRPNSAELANRLAGFWLPSRTVIYIGQTTASLAGRLRDYYGTPLGDRRPHAGGHWIKTLGCLQGTRVWWSATDDPHAMEDRLFAAFAATVPDAEASRLHDPTLVLPFANLQDAHAIRKIHGVSGAKLA